MRKSAGLLVLALLSLVPVASAHVPSEPNDLEILLIEDEGSDAIEPYGGFDILSVYLGMAHQPSVGVGEAGDGFYLRADLYGLMAEQQVPSPPGFEEWTVTFTFEGPNGPTSRSISTTDGTNFETDFEGFLYEIDDAERTMHIFQAFVSFASVGFSPGDMFSGLTIESRVGTDLRDVAPGGIPIPFTNGAAEYTDPTAIEGRGRLADNVPLTAPTAYLIPKTATADAGAYTIGLQSALKKTGQHVHLQPQSTFGWDLNFTTPAVISATPSQNMTFGFTAMPSAGAPPLVIDALTDVGGRLPITVFEDGHIEMGAITAVSPPPAEQKAPGPGMVVLLAGLALLGLAVRARNKSRN